MTRREQDLSLKSYLSTYSVTSKMSHLRGRLGLYRFIADQFVTASDSVIDVGCGEGFGAYCLSLKARKVLGIDMLPDLSEYAGERYGSTGLDYLSLDIMSGDVAIERADVICALDVIEHVPDDVAFVKALLDLARPGGTVIISTPNKLVSYVLFGRLYEYHLREYAHADIQRLIRQTGCSECRVYCVNPGYISSLTLMEIIKSRVGAKLPLALREWAKAHWVSLRHRLRGHPSVQAIGALFNNMANANILDAAEIETPEEGSDFIAVFRR